MVEIALTTLYKKKIPPAAELLLMTSVMKKKNSHHYDYDYQSKRVQPDNSSVKFLQAVRTQAHPARDIRPFS